MKKNKVLSLALLLAVTSVLTLPIGKAKAATTQTPITRSDAEKRAVSMMDLTWTYSASKNSNIASNWTTYVTQPAQFKGITTGQFTGIPYNWGGLDGLNSYSYGASWTNFLDAVNKGAFTGNVNTDGGLGLIPGTAGIDCSGFVQATFNINDYKQSTSTLLNNYFTKINLSDLKHMDILDKPADHVVIFDKWGTLNGVYGAFTYESTPDQTYGGIQGTKRYFMSMATINTGYIPARYNYIVEDAVQASPKFTLGGYAQVANVINYSNLRANAGTNYDILTTVPKGTILNLLNYTNGWYQVNFNGYTGWIYENILGAVPANKYVTVNNVYMLNVRLNPQGTAQIIGTITEGQIAEKLDQTSDGSWYKISVNGVTGWASSKYLTYIK